MNLLEEALMSKLSNFATKADLWRAAGVDMSELRERSELTTLKAEEDKINVDKLKTVLFYLRKLSNVVNNEFVKKTEYGKLVAKVNNIDASGFFKKKTKYDTDTEKIWKRKSVMLTKEFLILVDLLKNRL